MQMSKDMWPLWSHVIVPVGTICGRVQSIRMPYHFEHSRLKPNPGNTFASINLIRIILHILQIWTSCALALDGELWVFLGFLKGYLKDFWGIFWGFLKGFGFFLVLLWFLGAVFFCFLGFFWGRYTRLGLAPG